MTTLAPGWCKSVVVPSRHRVTRGATEPAIASDKQVRAAHLLAAEWHVMHTSDDSQGVRSNEVDSRRRSIEFIGCLESRLCEPQHGCSCLRVVFGISSRHILASAIEYEGKVRTSLGTAHPVAEETGSTQRAPRARWPTRLAEAVLHEAPRPTFTPRGLEPLGIREAPSRASSGRTV